MEIGLIMAFAAVSFLFVITPGADWAYSISAGINYRSPVPAIAGMLTLGSVHVVLTAIVYLMVGFLAMHLLRSRPTAAIVVSRLSGAMLIFVGLGLLAEQLL